ncbi:hypothetical protein [Jeotgalibacillus sp. R-1-5s-1]|uniref:hypothetical protein n=1 Tax=Jeotgalibacillus sp. R-1-5s-1 TaxID=2555897 RepID=UPI00106D2E78|nr:hypothetical protein [Jeotgalibacillus sp. R-1-5s-1]TFD93673.1 hypothetical protein E2491_14650 [Jeotgalibacillus sp. R-1-5s-1]
MPLPLIPLVVAGAAAVSAAIASKKGYDSFQNMKETKELAESLEAKYSKTLKKFESQRDGTNLAFEDFGRLKLEILDGSMRDFVNTFKQIKNIEFSGEIVSDQFVSDSEVEQFIFFVEKQVVKAGQVMTAGLASLAGGGLAAMGAVGATTTFAAASTGTAIATLSGIAAQNATLAFLGGGSLAAGGLGVAGGTMVLGGIALAPALAIGSLIFAATTERKLEEMYVKKAEVQTEIQKLESATNVMEQIKETTFSMHNLAKSVDELLLVHVNKMENIIEKNGYDFRNYAKDDQIVIHHNYKVAVIMRDLLNTTILNEQGELTPGLNSLIKSEKQKISTFQ